MNHGHTIESLVLFEQRVADAFEAKRVRGPIHLCSDGQAGPLLDVFREVRSEDWVFSTWRSHWHCLLKGVPEAEVFQAILDGRSMFLSFKEYRIVSSAIVGGSLAISLGVAMGIKRVGGPERVWVFAGDMAVRTGLFHEFAQYAVGHGLPIQVVIEDNGLSTNADTAATWGYERWRLHDWQNQGLVRMDYNYERTRPHTGTGKHVTF